MFSVLNIKKLRRKFRMDPSIQDESIIWIYLEEIGC